MQIEFALKMIVKGMMMVIIMNDDSELFYFLPVGILKNGELYALFISKNSEEDDVDD